MELRHLRYFQAVAETLSFSHASKRLRVAQSSVSRQIATLEEELGVKLFARTTSRVRLTDAGEHLHRELDKLLAQLSIVLTSTQEIARGRRGELRIGSDWRLHFPHIPEAILRYRTACPEVSVNVVELTMHAQLEALRDGRIHVAFAPGRYLSPDLEAMLLSEENLKIIIPARHPLAGAATIPLREMRSETWIRLDERNHPGYRATMIQLCHPALFTPRFGVVTGSIDGMLAQIAIGEGVCMLPASMISRAHTGLHIADSDCPPFQLYAVRSKQDANPLADGFFDTLRQALAAPAQTPTPTARTGRVKARAGS